MMFEATGILIRWQFGWIRSSPTCPWPPRFSGRILSPAAGHSRPAWRLPPGV